MRGTTLAPSSKFHCQLGASTSGTPGSISSTWEASSDLQALEQVFDNFTIGYLSLQLSSGRFALRISWQAFASRP
jgi:hypothetical protein